MKTTIKSKTHAFFSHERVKNFMKKSFIGGLTVILPVAAIFALFSWLWKMVVGIIDPITSLIIDKSGFGVLLSEVIALVAITTVCFFVGVFVTTKFGYWFHAKFDKLFAKLAPGYKMLKGVFDQLLSSEGSLSFLNGKPVFVFPYGKDNPMSFTGFVSSIDEVSGVHSIYCPIPMNPSSGIVHHVPKDWTIEIEGSTNEDVLKTIVSFGAGSNKLVQSTPGMVEFYKKFKVKNEEDEDLQ